MDAMPSRKRQSAPPPAYSPESPQPSPDKDEPILDMTVLPDGDFVSVRIWLADGRWIGAYYTNGRWWERGSIYHQPVRWQRVRANYWDFGPGWKRADAT